MVSISGSFLIVLPDMPPYLNRLGPFYAFLDGLTYSASNHGYFWTCLDLPYQAFQAHH